jgi:hypothetical protein
LPGGRVGLPRKKGLGRRPLLLPSTPSGPWRVACVLRCAWSSRIRVYCRLPNVKACLLSKSDFLREFLDAYTLCQRIRCPAPPAACPLLLGASCLLPGPGLALSRPFLAPTAFRPPCTWAPSAASCARRSFVFELPKKRRCVWNN